MTFLGVRWQNVPAAAGSLLLILLILWRLFVSTSGLFGPLGWLDYLILTAVLLSIVISVLAGILFPLIRLPAPTGAYPIGTAFTQWPGGAPDRPLSVQIWYPASRKDVPVPKHSSGESLSFGSASASAGLPIPFWWPVSTSGVEILTKLFQMPSFLLSHLRVCQASAVLHAPLITEEEAEGLLDAKGRMRLPVAISSHGFFGFKADRTHFCEELASHGFVVVGADHAGDCAMVVFPDGKHVPYHAQLKEGEDEWTVRNAGLDLRVEDVRGLLDQVTQLAAMEHTDGSEEDGFVEAVLRGRLDSERIGAMGHSYGAATCIQTLQHDSRIKAVVAMDPWLWPMAEKCEEGVDFPLLILSSEFWTSAIDNAGRRKKLVENSHESSHSVIIKDTKHHNFDDLPLLIGLPSVGTALGFIGKADPKECFKAINSLLVTFLTEYVMPTDIVDADERKARIVRKVSGDTRVRMEASSAAS